MRLVLNRPANYDRVVETIDEGEWEVSHMLFHVCACLDTMLIGMSPEVRHDLLALLGSRYNLYLSTDDQVKALEYERDALRRDVAVARKDIEVWRARAFVLQEELMNAGTLAKKRPM